MNDPLSADDTIPGFLQHRRFCLQIPEKPGVHVILLAPMCLLQPHECMYIQSGFERVYSVCSHLGYFRSSPAPMTETPSSLTYNNLISGRNLGNLLPRTAALV